MSQVAARHGRDPGLYRFETGPEPSREYDRGREGEEEGQGQCNPEEWQHIPVDRAKQLQVAHRKHCANRGPVGTGDAEAG